MRNSIRSERLLHDNKQWMFMKTFPIQFNRWQHKSIVALPFITTFHLISSIFKVIMTVMHLKLNSFRSFWNRTQHLRHSELLELRSPLKLNMSWPSTIRQYQSIWINKTCVGLCKPPRTFKIVDFCNSNIGRIVFEHV